MPYSRLRLRRLSAALASGVVVALLAASPAAAHSFLINSQPHAGARLGKAPASMTLDFSEAFVAGSQQVTIRGPSDKSLALPSSKASGATIRQPLPKNLHGVYIVNWRVLSDDGHISLGEFAFAVGSSAALPALTAPTSPTPWSEVAASWLVFTGLALALGGLASERFIWRRTPLTAREISAAPVFPGIALAIAGTLLQLVLVAGDQRGGGFSAGFSGSAIGDAIAARPGKLILALFVSLLAAAALLPLRWLRVTAILPLLAAVGFIAARGHSGTSNYGWAVVADIVHLAAVALWLGALAHLVLVVVRSGDRRSLLAEGARRYSRFALPTVILIIVTGILTAIPEFRSVNAVFTTGYGRTLLIKAAFIGVALLLALSARRWALSANPRPRLPLLKRLTAAEASVLAGALIVASVLVNAAPARGPAAAAAAPLAQLGPPPVAGPTVQFADLAGQLGLAVTAGRKQLQFTVVPPETEKVGKLQLTADVTRPDGRAADVFPRACGRTCFTIAFRLTPGTTLIRAHVSSSAWRGGTVRFAIPWPLPAERPNLVRRIAGAMNAVPALRLSEAVTSGFGTTTHNHFRLSGREFMKTETFAAGAVDVRPLAHERGMREVAFALPGSSLWYRVWIDRQFRLRRERILSPGHLILRTFRYSGVRAPGTAAARGPNRTPRPALTPTGSVPPPPSGSVVLAREDGDLGVGLGLRPRNAALELQTTVLSPAGGGLSGLAVSYRVEARAGIRTAEAVPCGNGCYRARVPIRKQPTRVSVRLAGAGGPSSTVAFALPSRWPPRPAGTLAPRATRVFRKLRSVAIDERLASSPKNVLHTRWQLEAPDRAAYQIKGGSQAIIIGSRRWDREPGAPWKRSVQTPLHQPTPFWTSETDAHVVGTARIGGRAARLVSFYDPGIPAFFTIAIDDATQRTLDLRMTAAAHFMHHRYSHFNTLPRISPPR